MAWQRLRVQWTINVRDSDLFFYWFSSKLLIQHNTVLYCIYDSITLNKEYADFYENICAIELYYVGLAQFRIKLEKKNLVTLP